MFYYRYDCCPDPLIKLKFHFTLKREFVVDPNLGRINNPEDNFPWIVKDSTKSFVGLLNFV